MAKSKAKPVRFLILNWVSGLNPSAMSVKAVFCALVSASKSDIALLLDSIMPLIRFLNQAKHDHISAAANTKKKAADIAIIPKSPIPCATLVTFSISFIFSFLSFL